MYQTVMYYSVVSLFQLEITRTHFQLGRLGRIHTDSIKCFSTKQTLSIDKRYK